MWQTCEMFMYCKLFSGSQVHTSFKFFLLQVDERHNLVTDIVKSIRRGASRLDGLAPTQLGLFTPTTDSFVLNAVSALVCNLPVHTFQTHFAKADNEQQDLWFPLWPAFDTTWPIGIAPCIGSSLFDYLKFELFWFLWHQMNWQTQLVIWIWIWIDWFCMGIGG